MALPAPNRTSGRAEARCIWFGQQYLLIGPEPDPSLSNVARLTDVSDCYAIVRAEGAEIEQVLARLVPVDVSRAVFKRGHTARTLIQHMTGSLSRISGSAFQILVFRSMALTLVHDIERAMKSIASRDQL
jgi:sarcosine oxidase subunit gamma